MRLPAETRHLLLYSVIGLSGATLDLVLFVLLLRAGVEPVPATMLSVLAGISNNYLLNARFNFSHIPRSRARYLRFLAVGLLGLALSALALLLFAEWVGLAPEPVKIASMPVVLVVQFVLNRRWTFS